ncbi:MAG: putative Ig domain-containing protein [Fibrobacterota bacterium]|nr:putative Ig domain-containing protein [Fibrobacterota bacterium]
MKSKNSSALRSRQIAPLLLVSAAMLAMVLWACQLTQSAKGPNTLSFTALYDSLKAYDSVTIVVKDVASGAVDTIFKGKVDSKARIQNLEAPHYNGQKAEIVITGFNAGKLAFQVDKVYEGSSGTTVSEVIKPLVPFDSVPSIPGISGLIAGEAKVVVSWSPIVGVTEYNLYYGEGGAVDKNSTQVKNITSPYEVKSLKNGTEYGFALTAANLVGESNLSPIKSATPQVVALNAPYIDSVSGGNGKVTLNWGPVPDALGYVLYYKAGQTVDKNGTKITSISSPYVLSGLTNGAGYAFAISALRSAGETGLSNIVTSTPQVPIASGLSYVSNPAVYWKGVPIDANPAVITGTVDSFTLSPALPAGLVLSKATGAITGTPSESASKAEYTIKARNYGGETTAILLLTVNAAPGVLTYKENPATYWQTVEAVTNTATVSGIVDSFTISPALPSGLVLSKSTGAISGTPALVAASAKYTVTARNPAGASVAEVTLNVNGPPSGFYYAVNPAVFYQGVDIDPDSATVSGAVESFTVSPALPAGLFLNQTTGTLTGKPLAALKATAYTVTARNAAGSPTVTLTLTIKGPPSLSSYSLDSALYWQSVAILQNTATVTEAESFTVSPTLPAGLSLNPENGAITGTPTLAVVSKSYTVTASNKAGSVTKILKLGVNGPPSGLTYSTNPVTYVNQTQIDTNKATVAGLVDSFTIASTLPSGLIFNKATGAITGKPTVLSASKGYVVTARNPAGSTTAIITLAIATSPLDALTYSTNPAVYWNGIALTASTQNSPTVTGGANNFTVLPAIPTGLILNASTGIITGTPTGTTAGSIKHTVTARNPSGASATVDLYIAVNGLPAFTYPVQAASYVTGTAITANTPASSGGPVSAYAIAPALSDGLLFNTSTGRISGTPNSVTAAADYVITATNPAGTGKDTINLKVTAPVIPGTIVLNVEKDISLDTGHSQGFNNGYTGASFIGKPGQPFLSLWKFDLSSAPTTGLKSAKVRYKTYGYGPIWVGSAKPITVKVYRLQFPWTEGTGNWNWYGGNWRNNGDVLYTNYPMSTAIKNNSTNYSTPAAGTLLYTDHYILRSENLTLAQTQNLTVNYTGSSIHANFSTAFPAPANLITLEIDLTDYVKGILAGTYLDYGYTLAIEGLGTDIGSWIGTINKEAGDGNEDDSDGNHGAKLHLEY